MVGKIFQILMHAVISSFALKRVKLSQTNCHLVMTVYTNILSGATIKLMFGENVWNAIRRSLLQMDMAG